MPPGGWHYPQLLSNGDTVRLTAFTFEQILETMREFRLRHLDLCGGAEIATIEAARADLKKYICAHFKQNCADATGTYYAGAIVAQNYQPPVTRAANWLASVANERQERVDAALAAQRAQICAQCPQNVRWQSGCQPCNNNVEVRSQQLKGSMQTPYDRNLLVCRVYGWKNDVAVWLSLPRSEPEHTIPSHCWVRKDNTNGQ